MTSILASTLKRSSSVTDFSDNHPAFGETNFFAGWGHQIPHKSRRGEFCAAVRCDPFLFCPCTKMSHFEDTGATSDADEILQIEWVTVNHRKW